MEPSTVFTKSPDPNASSAAASAANVDVADAASSSLPSFSTPIVPARPTLVIMSPTTPSSSPFPLLKNVLTPTLTPSSATTVAAFSVTSPLPLSSTSCVTILPPGSPVFSVGVGDPSPRSFGGFCGGGGGGGGYHSPYGNHRRKSPMSRSCSSRTLPSSGLGVGGGFAGGVDVGVGGGSAAAAAAEAEAAAAAAVKTSSSGGAGAGAGTRAGAAAGSGRRGVWSSSSSSSSPSSPSYYSSSWSPSTFSLFAQPNSPTYEGPGGGLDGFEGRGIAATDGSGGSAGARNTTARWKNTRSFSDGSAVTTMTTATTTTGRTATATRRRSDNDGDDAESSIAQWRKEAEKNAAAVFAGRRAAATAVATKAMTKATTGTGTVTGTGTFTGTDAVRVESVPTLAARVHPSVKETTTTTSNTSNADGRRVERKDSKEAGGDGMGGSDVVGLAATTDGNAVKEVASDRTKRPDDKDDGDNAEDDESRRHRRHHRHRHHRRHGRRHSRTDGRRSRRRDKKRRDGRSGHEDDDNDNDNDNDDEPMDKLARSALRLGDALRTVTLDLNDRLGVSAAAAAAASKLAPLPASMPNRRSRTKRHASSPSVVRNLVFDDDIGEDGVGASLLDLLPPRVRSALDAAHADKRTIRLRQALRDAADAATAKAEPIANDQRWTRILEVIGETSQAVLREMDERYGMVDAASVWLDALSRHILGETVRSSSSRRRRCRNHRRRGSGREEDDDGGVTAAAIVAATASVKDDEPEVRERTSRRSDLRDQESDATTEVDAKGTNAGIRAVCTREGGGNDDFCASRRSFGRVAPVEVSGDGGGEGEEGKRRGAKPEWDEEEMMDGVEKDLAHGECRWRQDGDADAPPTTPTPQKRRIRFAGVDTMAEEEEEEEKKKEEKNDGEGSSSGETIDIGGVLVVDDSREDEMKEWMGLVSPETARKLCDAGIGLRRVRLVPVDVQMKEEEKGEEQKEDASAVTPTGADASPKVRMGGTDVAFLVHGGGDEGDRDEMGLAVQQDDDDDDDDDDVVEGGVCGSNLTYETESVTAAL